MYYSDVLVGTCLKNGKFYLLKPTSLESYMYKSIIFQYYPQSHIKLYCSPLPDAKSGCLQERLVTWVECLMMTRVLST